MPRLLIVSFDLIRPGEPEVSLAIGSLMAYLRARPGLPSPAAFEHVSFNMFELPTENPDPIVQGRLLASDVTNCDYVAISCYVWCENLVSRLLPWLRNVGMRGTIILGGYQITYADRSALPALYPDANVFVPGYAESALLQAISDRFNKTPRILSSEVDFSELPSPYLTDEIPVAFRQGRVRLESKRGCPYRCSFCAHRDLTKNRVYRHTLDRIAEEIRFLNDRMVQKINWVDPVFNQGPDYLPVLREIADARLSALCTFQTRLELIRGAEGEEFLDLIARIGAHLEFGLQSIIEEEYTSVNRRNGIDVVHRVFANLKERGISYEVSLIYGLPNQTVDSFRQSIEFLLGTGCRNITAFPLMLLRGTELHAQRERWAFKEKPMGTFGIPVVVSSSSFSEDDWWAMKSIADGLDENERV